MAPNNPNSVLSTTWGWPVKKSGSASAKPLTRFNAYGSRSSLGSVPGKASSNPQASRVPTAIPATSTTAAFSSAPRRTRA